jgi:hypothetical protein
MEVIEVGAKDYIKADAEKTNRDPTMSSLANHLPGNALNWSTWPERKADFSRLFDLAGVKSAVCQVPGASRFGSISV